MNLDMVYNHLHVHGVTAVGEVEATLLLLTVSFPSPKPKASTFALLGIPVVHVYSSFLLIGEVLPDNVESFHVDLLVDVVLAFVNLFHSASLFNV